MRARIRETEWWPVLYLDTQYLDECVPGYESLETSPQVWEIPDDLVRVVKRAHHEFAKSQSALDAWWSAARREAEREAERREVEDL